MNALGGLEAVLRHHRDCDSQWGIDSRFVVLFESARPADNGRTQSLGLDWSTSIRDVRQRFGGRLPPREGEVVIYHDLWGVAILSDLDRSARRVGFIHCPADMILHCARRNLHLLDGILCVSPPVVEQLKELLPRFPPERIQFIPIPVTAAPPETHRPPRNGREFVIGYSGRLIKADKRVDRLPQLCDFLQKLSPSFRLEILGSGPMKRWLERKLRNCPKTVFHGEKRGPDYWKILSSWDAIVYVSDLEGMGLSLLEAMSVGVLPLYPDISAGGEKYVRQVCRDLLYRPGDLEGLARILDDLSRRPEDEIEKLRRRSREAVAFHAGDAYHKTFEQFIKRIAEAPRISQRDFAIRPLYFADLLPFAVVGRCCPGAFYRATPTN